MDVGGVAPPEGLTSLLRGLNVGGKSVGQEGLLQLYTELKECYEAQERAAPAEYAGDQDEDLKQACTQASLFFVARVLYVKRQNPGEQRSDNLGYSISRIVAAAGINLLDFFREANVVVSRLSAYFEARGSSSKVFSQLAQLKENSELLLVMGLLSKKYKDNFNTFLHQLESYKQIVLRLGWTAFLVLRVKLLSAFPDVVSCMELLPCVFAILASHAPRMPDCVSHIPQENRAPLLLKAISEICKADAGRVQARMAAVQALLTQTLTTAVPEWRAKIAQAKSEASTPTESGTALSSASGQGSFDLIASPVLEGLVTDPERINRVVAALEQEYEQHYARGGSELDERAFLTTDFNKFASPRFSPGMMHSVMAKLHGMPMPMPLRPGALLGPGAHTTAPKQQQLLLLRSMAAGLHSPLPMMHLGMGGPQPGTPVSEAMGASAWLRGVTAGMAAEPSAAVQRFLAAVPVPAAGVSLGVASAPPTAVQQLGRRVRDMVASVIPEEAVPTLLGPFPLLQPSLASERRVEAVKLYYHSLDVILVHEDKTSGMTGVTALLTSSKFHRGLVACCIEVVAACYRMVVCAFPKVLDVLRIKAFDMAKMIQTFVKSIDSLPRELQRHLFLIEEKIIESLAWEPGSSLYHMIMSVQHESMAAVGDQEAAKTATAAGAAQPGDGATSAGKPSGDQDMAESGDKAAAAAAVEAAAAEVSRATDHAGAVSTGPQPGAAAPGAAAAAQSATAPAGAPPPSPKRGQASAFSGLMSPVKKARGADGAVHVTQPFTEPFPQGIGQFMQHAPQPGSTAAGLYEFCRKVLKLASWRLTMICENFDFSPLNRNEVREKVYEALEHALLQQTHLFYNRHIDQIMLSALYGYCKVHKLQQVSFREIITQYRKQPQSQQAIFRSVVIEQSNPGLQIKSRADIIAFYNQVFVPAMKAFLLKPDAAAPAAPGFADTTPSVPTVPAGNSDAPAASGVAAPGAPLASVPTPGLPPLPPRSASQSPRSLKIPALSPIGRAGWRPPLRQDAEKPSGAGNSLKMDKPAAVGDSGPLAPPATSVASASAFPPDHNAGPNTPTDCSVSGAKDTPCGMPPTATVTARKGSGSRARDEISRIPECLAVLLQALDSQQDEDKDVEAPIFPEELEGDGGYPPFKTHSGPMTRSGRATAAAFGGSIGKGGRERALGLERRSTRLADRSRDADTMETDSLKEEEPSSPTGVLTGRRHRTPSRRYGGN